VSLTAHAPLARITRAFFRVPRMDVLELVKRHEGFRRKPYLCSAGKRTVGYGRNLDDTGISEVEAEWLLRRDIDKATAQLAAEPYWAGLDDVRRAVLQDMVVNLGWVGLSKFLRFRSALAARQYDRASTEMLDSAWHRQVTTRAKRLASMMQTGLWPRD
jgi:lysozyme